MENKQILTVRLAGERLDIYLAASLQDISRTMARRLINGRRVKIGDTCPRPSYIVRAGDLIEVVLPEPRELAVEKEEIPLDIVYEDADMVVVNKARGMVVHPAPGHPSGTLVNALLQHCKDLSGIGGVARPGIVHRLDKDTSGLIMVAKNDFIHQKLALYLKERSIKKEYIALVWGNFHHENVHIKAPLARNPVNRKKMAVIEDGREASTRIRRLTIIGGASLIEAVPETGRTHQIRVHLSYLGYPLVGDPLYGGNNKILDTINWQGQALHARRLTFNHPRTGEELSLRAPIPEDFRQLIKMIQETRGRKQEGG